MNNNTSSGGRLFLAAVPDVDTAARIHRLAEVLKRAYRFDGRITEPERFARLAVLSRRIIRTHRSDRMRGCRTSMPAAVRSVVRSLREFSRQTPQLSFVLIGDDGLDRLNALRRTLGVAMARNGLKHLAKKEFTPHITLLYAERDVEEHPIEPIGWTVSEWC
jgi:2'-5' RNA ligase